MQMLGAQVLFGFQFQSLFQVGYDHATPAERISDGCALATLLVSLAVLVCVPAQHRLVEEGEASRRLWSVSEWCAQIALATMALALACVSFSLAEHARFKHPWLVAALTLAVSLMGWFGLGLAVKVKPSDGEHLPEREMTDLHTKIDQMLTEARVVLPGVQAMLGFELIVVMTTAFDHLTGSYQRLHFTALALTVLSVILLLAPAAVHRLGFSGSDDAGFHRIGTVLVTAALVPLMFAIAADCFIAAWKLSGNDAWSALAAALALMLLVGLWYALPLAIRMSRRWDTRDEGR
jgi:Family of unknown function (DUF6328)